MMKHQNNQTAVRDRLTGATGTVVKDLSIIVVVRMDRDGEIRRYTWSQLEKL